MSQNHPEHTHLYLNNIENLFGKSYRDIVSLINKTGPLTLEEIQNYVVRTNESIAEVDSFCKIILSSLLQHELLYFKNQNPGSCFYFVNSSKLEEKLLVPIVYYLANKMFCQKDQKSLLLNLMKYWIVSENQSVSLTYSDNTKRETKKIFIRDHFQKAIKTFLNKKFITEETAYHEPTGTSLNFYKLDISVLMRSFSVTIALERLKTFFSPTDLSILTQFIENTNDNEKCFIGLNKLLENNELFRNGLVGRSEVESSIVALSRRNPPLLSVTENEGNLENESSSEKGERDFVSFSVVNLLKEYLDLFAWAVVKREVGIEEARVLRYLCRKEGAVDCNTIAEDCLLSNERCLKVLVFLWKEGFVEQIELSKKSEPVSNQVFFMWGVQRKTLYGKLGSDLKNSLTKCKTKLDEIKREIFSCTDGGKVDVNSEKKVSEADDMINTIGDINRINYINYESVGNLNAKNKTKGKGRTRGKAKGRRANKKKKTNYNEEVNNEYKEIEKEKRNKILSDKRVKVLNASVIDFLKELMIIRVYLNL